MRGLVDRLRGTGGKKSPPQLLMWYPSQRSPLVQPVPEPYFLRPFVDGDQTAWSALLNGNGQLGTWTAERVQGEVDGALVAGGQTFAVCAGELVACAGVYDRLRSDEACWEIGWIAAHPLHAGRGLGLQVAAAAVRFALALDSRPIYLLTDDFRLPAIKTYLKMGFVADLSHPSYAERWLRIFGDLGPNYASYRSANLPGENSR